MLAAGAYCPRMPDLWFVAGLAIGVAITGFCAVGSFDRGADSVRRGAWSLELAARQRAVILSERRLNALVARRSRRHELIHEIDRLRRAITRRPTTGDPRHRGLVAAPNSLEGLA